MKSLLALPKGRSAATSPTALPLGEACPTEGPQTESPTVEWGREARAGLTLGFSGRKGYPGDS